MKYYEMNDFTEAGKVSWYVKRSVTKRGVLIDMTSQKLSFIFHRNAVKSGVFCWKFLLCHLILQHGSMCALKMSST